MVIPPVTTSLPRILTTEMEAYGIGFVDAESITTPCNTPIFGIFAGLNPPLPPGCDRRMVENIRTIYVIDLIVAFIFSFLLFNNSDYYELNLVKKSQNF